MPKAEQSASDDWLYYSIEKKRLQEDYQTPIKLRNMHSSTDQELDCTVISIQETYTLVRTTFDIKAPHFHDPTGNDKI